MRSSKIFFKPARLENDDDDTRFPPRILLPLVLEMRSIVCPQDFLRNFFAPAFLSHSSSLRLFDPICGQIVFTMAACDSRPKSSRGETSISLLNYTGFRFCRVANDSLWRRHYFRQNRAINPRLLRRVCIGSG